MAKKLKPVKSLSDLRFLARDNPAYEKLAIIASRNLGGSSDDLAGALRWLEVNAIETGESGVVDEINFCRDLVDE